MLQVGRAAGDLTAAVLWPGRRCDRGSHARAEPGHRLTPARHRAPHRRPDRGVQERAAAAWSAQPHLIARGGLGLRVGVDAGELPVERLEDRRVIASLGVQAERANGPPSPRGIAEERADGDCWAGARLTDSPPKQRPPGALIQVAQPLAPRVRPIVRVQHAVLVHHRRAAAASDAAMRRMDSNLASNQSVCPGLSPESRPRQHSIARA